MVQMTIFLTPDVAAAGPDGAAPDADGPHPVMTQRAAGGADRSVDAPPRLPAS